MTASGMRNAIATIDVTAADTRASVVLTDVRPGALTGLLIAARRA
jgi:hypothetical protein